MAKETLTIGGIVYVTEDALTFGDYGGAGSVGLANIRQIVDEHSESICETSYSCLNDIQVTGGRYMGKELLEEIIANKPEVLDVYGDYSSRSVYIRADIDQECEYTKSLEDYPVLSEDEMSRVEMEWEDEAWESWLKSDLIHTLPEDEQERASSLSDQELRDAYAKAMVECNEYPTPEYSNVCIDITRIAESFREYLNNPKKD